MPPPLEFMARARRLPGCSVCSEPGLGGGTHARAGPVLSAFHQEGDFLESDKTLECCPDQTRILRGKCIGIEVSVLSEVDLKTCPAAFSGVLDSTFHFLSGLRPLNHQIMSSDNAGKWVKWQGQLHTERSLIHPLCWLCSPLHFKSRYLVFHNQRACTIGQLQCSPAKELGFFSFALFYCSVVNSYFAVLPIK